MTFNWTCPHCNLPQAVTEKRFHRSTNSMALEDTSEGKLAIEHVSIACANKECQKQTVTLRIGNFKTIRSPYSLVLKEPSLFARRVIPEGLAKPQPDYIPNVLVADYREACLIRDLSPKAAATLARRCIQGMIRDFCGIKKGRLIDEIKELNKQIEEGKSDRAITEESVKAIDQVREIGNIGAHMEKEINVIVDVDSGEAQVLIELIELLFDEWYVARETRKRRFAKLKDIADTKNLQKDNQKNDLLAVTPTDDEKENRE